MDISKELSKLNNNAENISDVVAKIKKEYENIEKKRHMFEMMEIAHKIKLIVPILLEAGVTTLRLSRRIREGCFGLELAPKDDKGERLEVRDNKNNFLPWFQSLMDIYMNITLNCKLTEEFQDKNKSNPQDINLLEEIEPQIYKALLSKELKTILDYNQLYLRLEQKTKKIQRETNKSKKI